MKYVIPAITWYPKLVQKEIVAVVQGRPYDRTESVNLGFEQHIISPIPEFKYTDISFTEACAIHAKDLADLAKSRNQRITVTCSGGMDSTSAIAAFLMYTDAEIDITYSESAIEEWPEFHDYVIKHPRVKNVLRFTFLPGLLAYENNLDRLWIGGDPGDIVFGCKMYRHDQKVFFRDENGIPYRKEYNMDLWAKPWEGIPDHHREFYEPIVAKAPNQDFENNYDLTQWLGFAMKWQLCETRLHICAGEQMKTLKSFFSGDIFQQWSMSNNHAVKCPGKDYLNLKYEAKRHLDLFMPDDSAFRQVKRDSLDSVWGKPLNVKLYKWATENQNNPELTEEEHDDLLGLLATSNGKQVESYEAGDRIVTRPGQRQAIRGQSNVYSYVDENWKFHGWTGHPAATRAWVRLGLGGKY